MEPNDTVNTKPEAENTEQQLENTAVEQVNSDTIAEQPEKADTENNSLRDTLTTTQAGNKKPGKFKFILIILILCACVAVIFSFKKESAPKPSAPVKAEVKKEVSPDEKINDSTVMADYFDKHITWGDFKRAVEAASRSRKIQIGSREDLKKFLNLMAEFKSIAEKAQIDGFNSSERMTDILKYDTERMIAQWYLDTKKDELKGTVSVDEAQLKEYYNENIKDFSDPMKMKARHILIKGDSEESLQKAKDILKKINEGAEFEKMAQEYSEGPSAVNGGDLGYFEKDQMIPEFSAVAFKMKPGEIKGPVKTQFGYHLIKCEDVKEPVTKDFESVKNLVEQVFIEREVKKETDAFVTSLKNKYHASSLNYKLDNDKIQDTELIAQIDDEKVYWITLKNAISTFPKDYQGFYSNAEARKRLLNEIVENKVLVRDAKASGFSDRPDIAANVEDYKEQMLVREYLNDAIQKIEISEDEIRKEYAASGAEVRASHILAKVEPGASEKDWDDAYKRIMDIYSRIKNPADFAAQASEFSDCPSKEQGGDLGYFTKGRMVKEFEDAAFSMKKGEITEKPVKTQFGYHLIMVTDSIKKPLDEVKPQITQKLRYSKQEKFIAEFIDNIKKLANIKIIDSAVERADLNELGI